MKKVRFKFSRDQFLIMQNKYKSDSAIAQYLNVSRQYIHALRKSYGISAIKSNDIKVERNKSIIKSLSIGKTIQEIAKDVNLSSMTVWRISNNFKKESEIA